MKRCTLLPILFLLPLPLLWAAAPPLAPDTLAELGEIDLEVELAPNQRSWAEEIAITLLTVGPGDPLYAWFGHSALIVDLPNGSSIMYDWGIFDDTQEHFYLNFARGRMYYYVLASNSSWRIAEALEEGRDVRLVELELPAEVKWSLSAYLGEHIDGEYATYLYHFYDDNCATRIRDIIDVATGGEFGRWAKSQSTGKSTRDLIDPYMIHRPLVTWALSALQGPRIDRSENRWDAMFLPEELEAALLDFSAREASPVVKKSTIVAENQNPRVAHRSSTSTALIISLSIALVLLILTLTSQRAKQIVLALFYLFLAILGSLLLFMMLFSDMDMTYTNINIAVINPLLLIPSLLLLFGRRRGSIIMTAFSIVTIILIAGRVALPSLFIQDNLSTLVVLLPLYLSGATLQRRRNREAR
ncbi:MAG: DUF4105 domain-containing protein [Sphaerochaeta sp.]|nr:DUF4105 domain-containing protein [Sphaerochaeta sp.]